MELIKGEWYKYFSGGQNYYFRFLKQDIDLRIYSDLWFNSDTTIRKDESNHGECKKYNYQKVLNSDIEFINSILKKNNLPIIQQENNYSIFN